MAALGSMLAITTPAVQVLTAYDPLMPVLGSTYPAEAEVRDGIVYGNLAQFEGTFIPSGYPDEADVLEAVVFGQDSEYLGTLSPGPPPLVWGQLWPRGDGGE